MKKIFMLSLSIFCMFAILLLTSCSSKSITDFNDAYYVVEDEMASGSAMSKSGAEPGFYDQYDSGAENAVDAEAPTTMTTATNRKIIYSSWMRIQTKEFDKSINALKDMCNQYGAYFESSSTHGNRLDYKTERSARYLIRVPVENYYLLLGKIGNVGSIVESGEDNRDVTEQYIDTEARLSSAKIREERVLEILENADKLDDVLALERELADIRYEIESMTGSLRKLDSLVSYATIDMNIEEVVEYSAPVVVPKTFGERLSQNFKDGWRDFVGFWQDFAVGLSYAIFEIITVLIFLAIIVVVIVLIIKSATRKRRHRKLKNAKTVEAPKQVAEPAAESTEKTEDNK